jgi:hypothetical protein
VAKQFSKIDDDHRAFIDAQKIFFVATAAATGRINLSPKGMDTFRILSPNRIAWLNTTGSGNETAAHVEIDPRMTIMFCAFEGRPLILRLYGEARAVHRQDPDWSQLFEHFTALPGARQIFVVEVDLVQTSCGMSIPFFDYTGEREALNDWARKKGEAGIADYWHEKNQTSIDGLPTYILEKSL